MARSGNSITDPDRIAAVKGIKDGTTTAEEVARKLGVQPQTVQRWVSSGRYTGAPAGPVGPVGPAGPAGANSAAAASRAERYVQNSGGLGQLIRVQNMTGRAILVAGARLAFAIIIAIALWLLLELDGEALEERRRRWIDLANKMSALKDAINNTIAPLKAEGAWNTSDKDRFVRYMDSYLAEVDQIGASAKTNADAIDTLLNGVVVLLGAVLGILSLIVVAIIVIAPLLATPAAPEAKAQIEILGVKVTTSVSTAITSTLGLLNVFAPFIALGTADRRFTGDQPNARGAEGTTFASIKIDFKLDKTN